jgi:hypothetical protein
LKSVCLEFVMRRFLIPLLLASAALTPATAIAKERDGDRDRPRAERSERSNSSEKRSHSPERPARAERAERPVHVERAKRPVHVERAERPVRVERAERPARASRSERPVHIERERRVRSVEPVQQVRRVDRNPDSFGEGVRAIARREQAERNIETRRRNGEGFDGLRDRIVENGDRTRDRDGRRWSGDRDGNWSGDRDGYRRDDRDGHRWTGDWRRDRRYDWRSHRSRYNSLYRFGRYYDPYRYGYRRFSIGFRLFPSYYSSNYWLNDPWQYRLPPAYGPYRWVRYYDDALLVNIYTGEVVDVIHSFFW